MVIGSLLRVWEVDVLGLNPTMESVWKITLYSQLMLTSILDGVGCTTFFIPAGPGPTDKISL